MCAILNLVSFLPFFANHLKANSFNSLAFLKGSAWLTLPDKTVLQSEAASGPLIRIRKWNCVTPEELVVACVFSFKKILCLARRRSHYLVPTGLRKKKSENMISCHQC